MLFGVGKCPEETEMKNKTCIFRIVPSKILGFTKVQQSMIRDKYVGRNNRSLTNKDLAVKKRRSNESDSSTEDGEDTTVAGANSRVTFGD